jgi:hypothetical protein
MRETPKRRLDARPDSADFRDRMYVPTLVEVPVERTVAEWTKAGVPVLDQGTEGACTGFALATVANYLLRTRRVHPDRTDVSPRMLYEMARRHDEWPGERYEGSSARGAMKGWHKHGVCAAELWPAGKPRRGARVLDDARAADARKRPLGAYFRVDHRDLVAMHAALAETGVLFATAVVHEGWDAVGRDGLVPPRGSALGGHAFAIVGYDAQGFWLQNSWGPKWGRHGFARIAYDDWLEHGTDVWVARVGVPVELGRIEVSAVSSTGIAGAADGVPVADLRPHVVSVGNDGFPRDSGPLGTSAAEVREILRSDFPRITASWAKRRIVLYAHGGLVSEESALQRAAEIRGPCLARDVYPLCFSWKTDWGTTIRNVLSDALRRRRPEGVLDAAKDFLLDRLDDALEPIARFGTGKLAWDEMKENALAASADDDRAAAIVAEEVARASQALGNVEVHLVGHSAGSIFHAPLVRLLSERGVRIVTCTLWAPACTVDLFRSSYLPAIRSRSLRRFALYTLTDRAERDDDCAGIYRKSLLYLVSHAFEEEARVPLLRDGTPILGMEKWVREDKAVAGLFRAGGPHEWVRAPGADGGSAASMAAHHGAFDEDEATLASTLDRICGRAGPSTAVFRGTRSDRARRRGLLG